MVKTAVIAEVDLREFEVSGRADVDELSSQYGGVNIARV